MTALTDMVAARATAGARYLAALQELRAAYVDLAAIDKALANRNVGVAHPDEIQTFTGEQAQEGVPHGLRHPLYAPDALGGWDRDANAQFKTYLATLGQS